MRVLFENSMVAAKHESRPGIRQDELAGGLLTTVLLKNLCRCEIYEQRWGARITGTAGAVVSEIHCMCLSAWIFGTSGHCQSIIVNGLLDTIAPLATQGKQGLTAGDGGCLTISAAEPWFSFVF